MTDKDNNFSDAGYLNWLIAKEELALYFAQRKTVDPHIQVAVRLNEIAQEILHNATFTRDNELNLTLGALFTRVMNLHKSLFREVALGYWSEADILGRAMIEAVLNIFELIRDPNYLETYIKSQNEMIAKLTKNLIADQSREKRRLPNLDLPGLDPVAMLKQAHDEGWGPNLRILAERNGLENLYELTYTLLNNAVHSKPNSINRHFEWNDKGLSLIQLPVPEPGRDFLSQFNLTFAETIRRTALHLKVLSIEPKLTAASELLAALKPKQ